MSTLGFKARVGYALFYFCGGEYNAHSLGSTSGATRANLLTVSVATNRFPTIKQDVCICPPKTLKKLSLV